MSSASATRIAAGSTARLGQHADRRSMGFSEEIVEYITRAAREQAGASHALGMIRGDRHG
jgi:hypothetical protein